MYSIFMHGRSRMTIHLRTPTMPGRSMSGFHRPGSLEAFFKSASRSLARVTPLSLYAPSKKSSRILFFLSVRYRIIRSSGSNSVVRKAVLYYNTVAMVDRINSAWCHW